MCTLRVDRLELKNFRCFEDCVLDLHPRLTVLVAENGRGKTALLDGLASALGPVVDELSGGPHWTGIYHKDIRCIPENGIMMPVTPAEVIAQGWIDGEHVSWKMELRSVDKHAKTHTRDLAAARAKACGIRTRLDILAMETPELAQPLPLVAFYGTGRLWGEQRLTVKRLQRDPSPLGRLSGYQDCLSSSSSFKTFASWFESLAESMHQNLRIAELPDSGPIKLLSAVKNAVKKVLEPTGWETLDWNLAEKDPSGQMIRPGYLFVEHVLHGRIPVSQLSDGVRNMVALVADIAHRCARLNPHLGEHAAIRTPGVLLIDEVDMHLHPRWQQEVAGLLREAFPELQIILTTHSPQVLTTVESESIRTLDIEEGKAFLETPSSQTMGIPSQEALTRVMRVNSTPDLEPVRNLSHYKALIQQGLGDTAEALLLRDSLNAHYGEHHSAMADCDRLARLQALKTRRPLGSSS